MYNDNAICKHFLPTETKVDVSWKAWAAWNNCGYPCNSGSQSRSRVCDGTPKYGGINNCVGSDTDSIDCASNTIPSNILSILTILYHSTFNCKIGSTYLLTRN